MVFCLFTQVWGSHSPALGSPCPVTEASPCLLALLPVSAVTFEVVAVQGAWQRMGDSAVLLTYSLPVKSANPVLIPFICTIVQTSSINLHFSSWFAGAGRVRKSPRAAGWLVASSRGSLLFGPASRLSHRSAWWQEEVQGGQVSCAASRAILALPAQEQRPRCGASWLCIYNLPLCCTWNAEAPLKPPGSPFF